MKKLLYFRPVKILITMCAFTCGYVLSSFLALGFVDSFANVRDTFDSIKIALVIDVLFFFISFIAFKLDMASYAHAGMSELFRITCINLIIFAINIFMSLADFVKEFSIAYVVTIWMFYEVISFGILFSRRFYVSFVSYLKSSKKNLTRVLIIGAGEAGSVLIHEINQAKKKKYHVVGLIDDDPLKKNTYYSGVKVYGGSDKIIEVAKERNADEIFISIPSAKHEDITRISNIAIRTKLKVRILPPVYELVNGNVLVSKLKDVDVCDLLGRDPVKIDLEEIMGYIEDKVVLVTGGGGSIGSELCRQIASHSPKQLIILDIYENNAYDIEQELKKMPDLNLVTLIASVRDKGKIEKVFSTYRPQIVFHAAAHKHVPLMETSPNEAVKNNVFGTFNTASCADKYGAEMFLLISTDKAVNPTNAMGATKRICEMVVQHFAKKSKTRFVCVRFGNVLGSNGSVIPLFKKQIQDGGPVTVTHKDIVRYFMTIPEAVSLVLQAGAYAKGGEIFVLDMGEQVKIYDLAKNLIRLSGYEPEKDIEIICTGLRPGEKLYEECLMEEEGLRKTANGRIRIGQPIEFDDKAFLKNLDKLYDAIYSETDNVKEMIKDFVPTYSIYKD